MMRKLALIFLSFALAAAPMAAAAATAACEMASAGDCMSSDCADMCKHDGRASGDDMMGCASACMAACGVAALPASEPGALNTPFHTQHEAASSNRVTQRSPGLDPPIPR